MSDSETDNEDKTNQNKDGNGDENIKSEKKKIRDCNRNKPYQFTEARKAAFEKMLKIKKKKKTLKKLKRKN